MGLVPTMGALHAGHMSLVRHAASENTDVFVSIYVNPTQFGLSEDLDSYPQTWESDLAQLNKLDEELSRTESAGRITVFAPTTATMYPTLPPDSSLEGRGTFVNVTPLGNLLEGASRPVFFRGVATVCLKLFNICRPDRVYFGQKDVQQTIVIRRMVQDLHVDTTVRIGPTVREHDGLAMSSRNVYLGMRRRRVAVVLNQTLRLAESSYRAGKRTRGDLLSSAGEHLNRVLSVEMRRSPSARALFEVDYLSLADPDTMEEIDEVDGPKGAVLSGAMKMLPVESPAAEEDLGLGGGKLPVRLIDNIILTPVHEL